MKGTFPTKAEVQSGKNYLKPDELYRLHLLSEQFLLYAESTALSGKTMTMASLHAQLDRLLTLNDYAVFPDIPITLKTKQWSMPRLSSTFIKSEDTLKNKDMCMMKSFCIRRIQPPI